MNKLYFEILRQVYFIKSIIITPLWIVKKLNVWKFIGINLLLWSIQIIEKHQYEHTISIGNKIVTFWIIAVILISCKFITDSSTKN
jgi:hypothetical protein